MEHWAELEEMRQTNRTDDECGQPDPNPAKTAHEKLMARHAENCTRRGGEVPDLFEHIKPSLEFLSRLYKRNAA